MALRRRMGISFLPAGLKLNIDFSAAGLTLKTSGIPFGTLTICNITGGQAALNGTTVSGFLGVAATALGGGAHTLSYVELTALGVELNSSFFEGMVNPFARDHLTVGSCP